MGPTNFGGIVRIDQDHGQQGRHLALWRQPASEFLLDQVADYALGARIEHIERVRLGPAVRVGLERQQADLRPVAVDDHDAVLCCQRRDRLGCDLDVLALHLDGHRI
jgi:hypothetical protein